MNIKKYAAILPIITSCSEVRKLNADLEGQSSSISCASAVTSNVDVFKADAMVSIGGQPMPPDPNKAGFPRERISESIEVPDGKGHRWGNDAAGCKSSADKTTILTVADGAGESDASGLLASHLVKYILSSGFNNPKELILVALRKMMDDGMGRTKLADGYTTVCVATINESNLLQWANVGDSGLMVIRDNKIVFCTEPNGYEFNRPYTLCLGNAEEVKKQCVCGAFQLNSGDLVLLASDGVIDNLDEEEIIKEVNSNPQIMLGDILKVADENSRNPNKISPFGKNLLKEWKAGDDNADYMIYRVDDDNGTLRNKLKKLVDKENEIEIDIEDIEDLGEGAKRRFRSPLWLKFAFRHVLGIALGRFFIENDQFLFQVLVKN